MLATSQVPTRRWVSSWILDVGVRGEGGGRGMILRSYKRLGDVSWTAANHARLRPAAALLMYCCSSVGWRMSEWYLAIFTRGATWVFECVFRIGCAKSSEKERVVVVVISLCFVGRSGDISTSGRRRRKLPLRLLSMMRLGRPLPSLLVSCVRVGIR